MLSVDQLRWRLAEKGYHHHQVERRRHSARNPRPIGAIPDGGWRPDIPPEVWRARLQVALFLINSHSADSNWGKEALPRLTDRCNLARPVAGPD